MYANELVTTLQVNDGANVTVSLFTNTEDTQFRVEYNHDGFISDSQLFDDIDKAVDHFNEIARGEIKGYMGQ